MALTDLAVRNAKFVDKPFRITDGEGMYLLVNAAGKYWRLDYRYLGTRKTLALGTYPKVSLAAARQKRAEAKQRLHEGIDPVEHKRLVKRTRLVNAENTFQAVALEWFSTNKHTWVDSHSEKILARLEKDIFPWLGKRPIAALRRIEGRGAVETAHRAHQNVSQVFRYAIATGRAERDIAADLRSIQEKHMVIERGRTA